MCERESVRVHVSVRENVYKRVIMCVRERKRERERDRERKKMGKKVKVHGSLTSAER